MKQILTVFSYTFKEGIRKKAFLVSTVIIMAIIMLLCLAPRVISVFQKEKPKIDESTVETGILPSGEIVVGKDGVCYFIDETGIFQDNLTYFKNLYPDLTFLECERDDLEERKQDVADFDDRSMIYIEKQEGAPVIHVINPNFMKGVHAQKIMEICDTIWQAYFWAEQGVKPEIIAASQIPLSYTEEAVGEMSITRYILGLVMTFVMFFAVYYYGYGVAMSVASEKTSRVMETLIISAKPSRILVGKCLAMGAVGLLQLGGLLVFGGLCYSFFLPEGFQIAGLDLSFSGFTFGTTEVLAVYFILGYTLYAVINSVCGAAVSKVEDLNSAMMPVSVIAIIGFYLGYFTSVAGGGSNVLSKLAVYLPISSPFAVPFKILTGDIKTVELAVSIGLLAGTILVVTVLSVRVYSASVMHYGNRLKWKDLKKIKTN